ncbi:MAG: hypothetical protein K2K15_01855 [Anaeroplasmataceae bacterium]|nr:hypothetical protein [Anaeroplasmataceae bacterium]
MKKIKAIVVTLTLFFCLGYFNQQANASQSVVEIFIEEEIENTAVVLNSGYYILGIPNYEIEDVIKGDYDYAYLKQNDIVYRQDFEYTIGCQDANVDDLISHFNNAYNKTLMRNCGAYIFKVNSYAAFYTNECIDFISLVYQPTQSPNMNASIAGNMTHFVDIDHPLSLETIKSRYTASDNVDGVITSRLHFETNYDPNKAILGKYYILVSVKDSANHEAVIVDLIWVKDFTGPVLTLSTKEVFKEVKTPFTSEDAKKLFSAKDNCTDSGKIRYEFEDNYNNQYNTLGHYTIKAKAYDAENNCSNEEVLTIHIEDTTDPVITLKDGGDTIISNHPMEISEIQALLKVTDNYFELSPKNIQITHNCNGEQGKEFEIIATIVDGEGNEGMARFKYYLTDTIAPIIMVQNALYIPLGVSYTNEQIIQMLEDAGIIDIQTTNVSAYDLVPTDEKEIYPIRDTEVLEDRSTDEGAVMLNIFKPVETLEIEGNETHKSWYFFLLIPIFIIGAGGYFLYHRKKYEKK